jgi:ectoine hydroxylase-related dioxygenase (phytanoyl-CoA dioxygenase family)
MGEGSMKSLSPDAVARYHRDGFLFPVRVLTPEQASDYRVRLEAVERERGGPLGGELRHKGHLLFTWLHELIRHPRILDAVEAILGPNLLCWSSSFFIKEARDPAFVSWHQDSTYWGLSEPDVLTAWVAFSDSSIESGAMRMVPGSHAEQVAHRDTFAPNNLLSRGQEIAVEVDEARAVDVVLRPGEMSLHHVRMFHGSPPNRSGDRRIGYAIRYIPTHLRQVGGTGDSATLVRGVDQYHHFDPEETPLADLDPAARAHHAAIMKRQGELLYRGTTTATRRFR